MNREISEKWEHEQHITKNTSLQSISLQKSLQKMKKETEDSLAIAHCNQMR